MRASGINIYKYRGRLYYSSLGSLILSLYGVKHLLFVLCGNPKDYSVLVNMDTFGGLGL